MRKLFTLLSLSALVLLTANLPLAAKGNGRASNKTKRIRKLLEHGIPRNFTRKNPHKKNQNRSSKQKPQPKAKFVPVPGTVNVFRAIYD